MKTSKILAAGLALAVLATSVPMTFHAAEAAQTGGGRSTGNGGPNGGPNGGGGPKGGGGGGPLASCPPTIACATVPTTPNKPKKQVVVHKRETCGTKLIDGRRWCDEPVAMGVPLLR